jgi:hypothetical protein
MAIVEYFFIKLKDKDNNYLDKDIIKLIKDKVDTSKPNDMYCESKTCSVLLAKYVENNSPHYSLTYDFTKLTNKTVTSALMYNILEDIDTFKDLNDKTLALVKYIDEEVNIIKDVLKSSNDIDNLIEKLENINLDFFKIYKIIKENNLNKTNQQSNLLDKFHKKNLKRYKKDKTFFNTFKYKDRYIIQIQKNSDAADYRKIEEYLNYHLFADDNIRVIFERIFDSEFMEMLKHHDLKYFEVTYHGESKENLVHNDANNVLFAISDLLGKNTTKISAVADENSALSNEKVLDFFEMINGLGILDECKIKPKIKGHSNFTKANDKGSILKYSTNTKMETLDIANMIFLEAFKEKESILDERTL